jgi:uncharacterized protein
MPVSDLDLYQIDEMISFGAFLKYDFEIERQDNAFFAQGSLEIPIHCECVRCLKRFEKSLILSPWSCFLPLEGEEKVLVINDSVDLTPYLREDIVLALPQHPLCDPDCGGLKPVQQPDDIRSTRRVGEESSNPRWSDLDKLKL